MFLGDFKMSNPPNSAPFSFGQTSTSGNTINPTGNKVQGSLFGTTAGLPPSTNPNLFGNTPTTSAGQTPSTFGGTGNLFGSSTKTGSTGFNFGPAPQAGGTASADMSSFSTPNKTSEPSTISQSQAVKPFGETTNLGRGGLFGNQNTSGALSTQSGALTPISKSNIGYSLATSTTPAGPPPSDSGAVGNPGSIFSFTKTEASKPISFGAASGLQSTSQEVKYPAVPAIASGGFPATAGGIFGARKTSNSDTSSSNPPPNTNIFGKPSSTATSLLNVSGTTPSSGGGIFGHLSKARDKDADSPTLSGTGTNASTTAAKSPSLFPPLGGQGSSGTSFFGGPSPTVSTGVSTPSLFPSATSPQDDIANLTFPPITTTGFGSNAATETSGPSIPHTTATSGGIFPPSNQTKTSAPNPAPVPTTSATGGQQPSTSASEKFKAFGAQGQPGISGAGPAAGQPATLPASDTPANPGAGLGTSTAGPAPPAQSRLKNKSMDEIITRWASDLSTYQKQFRTQAEKVSVWDRMLVENSDKIQKLYGSTLEAERATTEVERQLTMVENDQEELQIWLEHYERELSKLMSGQVGSGESLLGPDQERDKTYVL